MVTFIGTYSAKVDDKGRMVLPAAIRRVMPVGGDMRFVIKKGIFSSCLEMSTYDAWSAEAEDTKAKLDPFKEEHEIFWRENMRGIEVVEPDAKLGRISIPRTFLDAIGVTKEVVFLGIGSKMEIWAKDAFERSRISHDEYVAIARSLSRQ
jgi:MraZ protein